MNCYETKVQREKDKTANSLTANSLVQNLEYMCYHNLMLLQGNIISNSSVLTTIKTKLRGANKVMKVKHGTTLIITQSSL